MKLLRSFLVLICISTPLQAVLFFEDVIIQTNGVSEKDITPQKMLNNFFNIYDVNKKISNAYKKLKLINNNIISEQDLDEETKFYLCLINPNFFAVSPKKITLVLISNFHFDHPFDLLVQLIHTQSQASKATDYFFNLTPQDKDIVLNNIKNFSDLPVHNFFKSIKNKILLGYTKFNQSSFYDIYPLLPKIKEVIIINSKISSLPFYSKSIQEINMMDSILDVERMENILCDLDTFYPQLQSMSLKNTKLKKIPYIVSSSLEYIDLSYNYFMCDIDQEILYIQMEALVRHCPKLKTCNFTGSDIPLNTQIIFKEKFPHLQIWHSPIAKSKNICNLL